MNQDGAEAERIEATREPRRSGLHRFMSQGGADANRIEAAHKRRRCGPRGAGRGGAQAKAQLLFFSIEIPVKWWVEYAAVFFCVCYELQEMMTLATTSLEKRTRMHSTS